MTRPPPGATPGSAPARATIIGIAAAAGLVPLNSTMIAVALPDIGRHFDVSPGRVSVLVTVYLAAMLAGQPLAGRLGDRVGSRTMVVGSLVGIALTSVLAAVAPSLVLLVSARALQAVFAAGLVPGVQAMLRSVSPAADRGRSFGILGSVLAAAAAAGPIVGGAAVQLAGWRALFLVNVPVVVVALLALGGTKNAPATPETAAAGATPEVAGRVANPVFLAAFAVQALSTQGQYALLLLTPVVLAAQGWSAGSIGLALSALTAGMVVTGPRGGRTGDRHGRRMPVVGGLAVAAVAIAVIAVGGQRIEPVLLVAALAVFGLGLGFSVPSVMTAALESVREDRTSSAAGVLATSRYVGSITASIAISVVVTGAADGSQAVLAVTTMTMLVACVAGAALPGRARPGPGGSPGQSTTVPTGDDR